MTALEGSDYPFALCLTHDVDKPFKTPFHAVYYALLDRDPWHLRSLVTGENTYWQFEEIMELEASLGVRSSFYFLNEPPVTHSLREGDFDLGLVTQAIGRYDVRSPSVASAIRELDERGWEVGLHGSYNSETDRSRLAGEKARIESVLGDAISGGRQHYLNLSIPETWRHQRAIGLKYDASLGSQTDWGFKFGYDVQRPFDDDFVVFPLTLMEQHLPDPGDDFERAWAVCESLLETAAEERAVMTVLFHPRYFSERDFPGYRRLYRRLVKRALDADAWVGPPGEFYSEFLEREPRRAEPVVE